MKLIELHILQSVPVTCLNRDDVGAPKSALFGGVQRARVSSQCWKRAVRELAHEFKPELFAGERTKFVVSALKGIFIEKGEPEERAAKLASVTANAIGTLDKADKDGGDSKMTTLLFFTQQELEAVADKVINAVKDKDADLEKDFLTLTANAHQTDETKEKAEKGKKGKKSKMALDLKSCVKGLGEKTKDMADIALFGRMVADDATLTMEGAALFSHAISTHAVSNELDFFSAVDEAKKNTDDAGAGYIGTIEFNSACYYRYIGVNLGLLQSNLGDAFDENARRETIKAFLKAVILAVPTARKNSMFGFTPPAYVLGVRREGQPLSLANAFESPVESRDGFINPSREALNGEWEKMKRVYGVRAEPEAVIPDKTLDEFIDSLTQAAL